MAIENIKIIEGGTPEFSEVASEHFFQGIAETAFNTEIVHTEVRAVDGQELLDRFLEAKENKEPIFLEYPSLEDGVTVEKAQIVAAASGRYGGTDVVELWVLQKD